MRIFVAGPYGDHNPKDVIAANVAAADAIGRELLLRGHIPFIPHKMTHGWEDDDRFVRDDFLKLGLHWLALCEAIFVIAPSPGTNMEMEVALSCGKPIFLSLGEVPDGST